MFGKCVNLHKTKTVNMRNREEIQRHPMFRTMETIALYMDRYYLDGVIGLIPGIGDVFSALCALPFVYFSLFIVRSVPLALVVFCNALLDVLVGMVPFFVGNVLDFIYRSNTRNLKMVIGFVKDDREIVREVNRRALATAVTIVILLALIVLTAVLLWKLGQWLF